VIERRRQALAEIEADGAQVDAGGTRVAPAELFEGNEPVAAGNAELERTQRGDAEPGREPRRLHQTVPVLGVRSRPHRLEQQLA